MGSSVLEDARQRPTAAKGSEAHARWTLPSLKARQEAA